MLVPLFLLLFWPLDENGTQVYLEEMRENVILLVILNCGTFLHLILIWATGREFLLNESKSVKVLLNITWK
jgi:hypothetical protein